MSFFSVFRLVGEAKLKAMKDYLGFVLSNNTKVLVFADSFSILDEIENFLKKESFPFVRFDEKSPRNQFYENSKIFDDNLLYKVALISLKIVKEIPTMAIASHVVFLEVFLVFWEKIKVFW